MAKIRSRNKTSDKGKIHFYQGRYPTKKEVQSKRDDNQALLIDEVKPSNTPRMKIVITWIPPRQRSQIRKQMDHFDTKKKSRGEVKYSNTDPETRIRFYESVMEQDFEVYDSFSVEFPPDVISYIGQQQGHPVSYWQSRYLYQLESVIRQAVSEHKGRIDIVMDYPPFEIIEEIRQMCLRLIGDGVQIEWFTISPSRHVPELQVQDILGGLDYDIRTGYINNDPGIKTMTVDKQRKYGTIIDKMRGKMREKR